MEWPSQSNWKSYENEILVLQIGGLGGLSGLDLGLVLHHL